MTQPTERRAFVITGATGATAPFVARALLARGDRLLLTGRNASRLAQLEAELSDDGIATFVGDVAEPEQATAAAAAVLQRFGRLDGLVHLAGSFHAGTPVVAAEPDLYLDLYRANVLSAAMATRAVLRRMEGPGWLVYITSLLALEPMPAMAPYAASKSALLTWVKGLAREVADRGIHANAVVSTLIDTPSLRAQRPDADHGQWVPAGDLAEVVAFLTSPASGALYGSAVPAYGRFALYPPPGALGVPSGPGRPPTTAGPPSGAKGPAIAQGG
jgi:3-oxoacyl-[acyl-carrier protein] reductase